MTEFVAFPKMARLSREVVITEKIDGTNGCIFIEGDEFLIGSRSRWLTKESDNFGFHKWATENKEELLTLGAGRHFGEWWGSGIQRGYGLQKGEKRFSLFNTCRWKDVHNKDDLGELLANKYKLEEPPACCYVVPVLLVVQFSTEAVEESLRILKSIGSYASPGFMNPEGVVVWHTAGNFGLKKTLDKDQPKTL